MEALRSTVAEAVAELKAEVQAFRQAREALQLQHQPPPLAAAMEVGLTREGVHGSLSELILPAAPGGVPSASPPEPADAAMPDSWMDEMIPRSLWEGMGLDVAPFCVQAEAPMHLVHFYFSQLTLNAVFVTDKGKFVGMINKADMVNAF